MRRQWVRSASSQVTSNWSYRAPKFTMQCQSTDGNFVTREKVAAGIPLSRVFFPFPFSAYLRFHSHGNSVGIGFSFPCSCLLHSQRPIYKISYDNLTNVWTALEYFDERSLSVCGSVSLSVCAHISKNIRSIATEFLRLRRAFYSVMFLTCASVCGCVCAPRDEAFPPGLLRSTAG